MAHEFKIKTGLLLGALPTQPVTSIQDTSISITSDASSLLATGKSIYDFVSSNTYDQSYIDASISALSAYDAIQDGSISALSAYDAIQDGSIALGIAGNFWELDTSILSPSDNTVNVELASIQIGTDAGTVAVMNMDVSAATTGTEESYAFQMDGSTVAKAYGKADGAGALSETGWVVATAQYMGDPNTNGSWRFYPNVDGDLVFEKRIAGTWTQKGKFTE